MEMNIYFGIFLERGKDAVWVWDVYWVETEISVRTAHLGIKIMVVSLAKWNLHFYRLLKYPVRVYF